MRHPREPVLDERAVDRLVTPPARALCSGIARTSASPRRRKWKPLSASTTSGRLPGTPGTALGLDELADEGPHGQLDAELGRERSRGSARREHERVAVELERVHPSRTSTPPLRRAERARA